MDDNAKNTCSYQVDQELLDARGINMTVEEVAGLSTSKYSERVQSLKLCEEDLAFLKGLRRRIKNRLASQNSRRRSVEHLRRLTRELRAVRACRRDALADRRALVQRRDVVRDKCASLRRHLVQILQSRSDTTEVPSIDVELPPIESQPKETDKLSQPKPIKEPKPYKRPDPKIFDKDQHISVIVKNDVDRERLRQELEKEKDIYERVRQELQKERETILIKDVENTETLIFQDVEARETLIIKEETPDYEDITIEEDFDSRNYYDSQNDFDSRNDFDRRNDFASEYSPESIFECKVGKLVTQSVNHIYNDKKKVFAKTVFIANDKLTSNIQTMVLTDAGNDGVLNLSVKEGRRKSHGRKQSAPRRITCFTDTDDGVLDLKMKKESK